MNQAQGSFQESHQEQQELQHRSEVRKLGQAQEGDEWPRLSLNEAPGCGSQVKSGQLRPVGAIRTLSVLLNVQTPFSWDGIIHTRSLCAISLL